MLTRTLQITNIKIPTDHKSPQHQQRGFAYVEFEDEAAMKLGLEKGVGVRIYIPISEVPGF